ncbi:HAD family phosphatase [Chloracidobacterium validum]|uniref:HAD family phosphatase n=1 Tax=Chloracidobacterium validum TaxID=2821543 RepID=A0ABX8BD86_9BACT|nr:HAD family phosphatase [Chloracidobacterium validum]QUW03500.1 HAD family phosphatase [Chloracidobacterium validum]
MIKAVIFDFDGVIVDSEEIHFTGLRDTLLQEGLDINRQTYDQHFLALDDKGCFRKFFLEVGVELSLEKLAQLIHYKTSKLEMLLPQAKLFHGVSDWIKKYSPLVQLAICSGALRQEITTLLSLHSLLEHFSLIISADDVQHGKPSPEGYLLALNHLNKKNMAKEEISASECLVIEDSVAGVEAAKAAGMHCVAITNSYAREKLYKADFIFESISQLNLESIQNYLSVQKS